jgi:serine/threonine protein kinase
MDESHPLEHEDPLAARDRRHDHSLSNVDGTRTHVAVTRREDPQERTLGNDESTDVHCRGDATSAPWPPSGDFPTAPLVAAAPRDGAIVLGPYELLDKLGQGGMGVVFKARHTRLDKLVAIKVLAKQIADDPEVLERFNREMKAVGALEHANIVRALDADEHMGTHYLVLEYIEGQNLQELVKQRGPLAIADACWLVRQTALALAHAHERGLVHRDIKPSNLMLTKQGQLKVLDLGLVLLVENAWGPSLTASGDSLGTPDYMAPEQWADARRVDHRTDLYALGCTLYCLLVGCPPFGYEQYRSAANKMTAHMQSPVRNLRDQRAEVPEALARLCCRLLEKSPENRTSSAAELARELEPFCGQPGTALTYQAHDTPARPVDEPAPAFGHNAPLSCGRRRLGLLAGSIVTAAVLLTSLVVYWPRDKGHPSAHIEFGAAQAGSPDRRAAEQTLALGGAVTLDFGDTQQDVYEIGQLPPGNWRLTSIHLEKRARVDDEFLRMLPVLPSLTFIDLTGTNVGHGTEELTRQTDLRDFYLGDTRTSDAELSWLAKHPTLQLLAIHGTPVTDSGLGPLTAAPRLSVLGLDGRQFTGRSLAILAEIPELRELHLVGPTVIDEHMRIAARLTRLKKMILAGTLVTPGGIEEFRQARPDSEVVQLN